MTNWNNKVLYVGITNNLVRRGFEHKGKMLEGFTKKYNVTRLVFFEAFTYINYINDAISAEKKIKGWTRKKKIALIESKNSSWKDLFPIILENAFTQGTTKDSSLRSG